MADMQLLDAIANNAPTIGVSLVIGVLVAILTFGAMFALTAELGAGFDFLGLVGLPVAGIASIAAFIVAYRKIRAD